MKTRQDAWESLLLLPFQSITIATEHVYNAETRLCGGA